MAAKLEMVQVGKSGTKTHYALENTTYTLCGQGGYRGALRATGENIITCDKCKVSLEIRAREEKGQI